MTEHKTFIRKIKQGDKNRYAEVWNERQGKKVIQHHVRYLGSDPNNLPEPSSFNIEKIHFGYLAQLLLSDILSADDVYHMLDRMGKSIERKEIKEIVIRHNLDQKKTRLHLVFPRKRKTDAQSAIEDRFI
ncbi:MAG: hypothetical protein ACT6FF_09720 [Methanosarcinaceae archaeon]